MDILGLISFHGVPFLKLQLEIEISFVDFSVYNFFGCYANLVFEVNSRSGR